MRPRHLVALSVFCVALVACGEDVAAIADRSSLVPPRAGSSGTTDSSGTPGTTGRSGPSASSGTPGTSGPSGSSGTTGPAVGVPAAPALPAPAVALNAATAVGSGVIVAGRDNASFNFALKDVAPPGDVTVYGSVGGTGFRLKGTATTVTITAGQLLVTGTGSLGGVAASFSAQAAEGSPDAFSFAIRSASGNYELAGYLTRGDITITPKR